MYSVTNIYEIMNKSILFLIVLLIGLTSCQHKKQVSFSVKNIPVEQYESFGEVLTAENIYYKKEIVKRYNNLVKGDTVSIAFTGTVNGVCKAKGCWMKVAMGDGKETMVRFKNYGFFVPKDIENDTVIVQGRAFVGEMSVDDQRHYATDAGKSPEEIAAITEPKKTYSLIAESVLIKN